MRQLFTFNYHILRTLHTKIGRVKYSDFEHPTLQGVETLLCGNPRVSLRLPWAMCSIGPLLTSSAAAQQFKQAWLHSPCTMIQPVLAKSENPGCRFACPGLCAPLGFYWHHRLRLSNSSKLDCIRLARWFSPSLLNPKLQSTNFKYLLICSATHQYSQFC